MKDSLKVQEENKKKSIENTTEVFVDKKSLEDTEQVKEVTDTKERVTEHEDTAQKELREKIENFDLADSLKIQASNHANTIQSLSDEEKLKTLLKFAKEKGVIYAVHMAKKMDNPYILDTFHDMLAKEGYYKEFLK